MTESGNGDFPTGTPEQKDLAARLEKVELINSMIRQLPDRAQAERAALALDVLLSKLLAMFNTENPDQRAMAWMVASLEQVAGMVGLYADRVENRPDGKKTRHEIIIDEVADGVVEVTRAGESCETNK